MVPRTLLPIISLAILVSVHGQEQVPPILREWVAAVSEHIPGEPDAAVERMAALTNTQLETLRRYVAAFALDRQRSTPAWRSHAASVGSSTRVEIIALKEDLRRRVDLLEFWKRAALLHTDVVLLMAPPPTAIDAPTARRLQTFRQRQEVQRSVLARTPDGRLERFELASPHWDFAKEMLAILPESARDPIVPLWYRTVGAYFAGDNNFGEAQTHFSHGRRMLPRDPHVAFGEACLEESLGAPRIQAFVRATWLPNGLSFLGVQPPGTHFNRARALLERALAADAAFVEARLRLGRVLIELERSADAIPHLQRVLSESTDTRLTFFAHLFIGDAAQALNRAGEARVSYQKAVAVFPGSHAARTALSYVDRIEGDRSQALAALMPTLSRPADDDPWWQYYLGDSPNLSALLEQLRAPHRKALR